MCNCSLINTSFRLTVTEQEATKLENSHREPRPQAAQSLGCCGVSPAVLGKEDSVLLAPEETPVSSSLKTLPPEHGPHHTHEDMGRRKAPALLGTPSGAATLENGLVVSYKTKHTLALQSSNRNPLYLTK